MSQENDRRPQLLSLCSQAWEPQLLKLRVPRTHAPQQEDSSMRSPLTAAGEWPLLLQQQSSQR